MITMPSLRGLDISVFSYSDSQELPEYPRPDSSSAHLSGLQSPQCSSSLDVGLSEESSSSDQDIVQPRETDPKASVYIPSPNGRYPLTVKSFVFQLISYFLPCRLRGLEKAFFLTTPTGSQFSIKYSVTRLPNPPCKYVFFRLYMNGRGVASWGIDPTVRSTGFVTRSLWQPNERWQDQVGIEGRSFFFTTDEDQKSVAEDGGQVEVQVFRAKGRKPRAPALDKFRSQERYGIV